MRPRFRRHLGSFLRLAPAQHAVPGLDAAKGFVARALLAPAPAMAKPETFFPPEFSAHQYPILLLHIAAEIEHALMVEYLYAAYSLGGPQVPAEHQAKVAQWQEVILGIAKEEMGHLMTVQNLLRCLGGPLNLDREDYPWDSELTPFPFRLEPLSLPSPSRLATGRRSTSGVPGIEPPIDALAAIQAISTQGEAAPDANPDSLSHFARFLKIFSEFPADEKSWSPSRKAPIDPYVSTDLTGDGVPAPRGEGTPIEHPEARLWAHLFNVRYQLLLTCLLHTFDYPGNLSESSQMTPRGLLIHATFGEMYNLRGIAMMLVQTPLAPSEKQLVAGAPFQMPYTLELPLDDVDRWRVHLDLFQATTHLVEALLELAPKDRHRYLLALREADGRTAAMIDTILDCHARPSIRGASPYR